MIREAASNKRGRKLRRGCFNAVADPIQQKTSPRMTVFNGLLLGRPPGCSQDGEIGVDSVTVPPLYGEKSEVSDLIGVPDGI